MSFSFVSQLTNEQAAAEADPTVPGSNATGSASGGPGGKDGKAAAGKDAKADKKGGKSSAGKGSAGKAGKKGAKKADEPIAESLFCLIDVFKSETQNLYLTLDVVELTPEEQAKKELRAKMREEYLAALAHEGKN